MKKPKEIKKGLECCQHDQYSGLCRCEKGCPYWPVDKCDHLRRDALEYIQQLEAKLLDANEKIKQQNEQLDHLTLSFAKQTREVAEYKLALLKRVEEALSHLSKEG